MNALRALLLGLLALVWCALIVTGAFLGRLLLR